MRKIKIIFLSRNFWSCSARPARPLATPLLQLELDALLCKQNVEQLLELAVYFDVEEAVEGRSRCQLVRIIRNAVKETLSHPKEDFNVTIFLNDAISKVKGTSSIPSRPTDQTKTQHEILDIEQQLADLNQLQIESNNARQTLLEQLKNAKGKLLETNPSDCAISNVADNSKPESVKPGPSVLVREFKISGQIGEPGQHDKLTYVSLIHQIDSGLEKGYSEKEVCDAIIKSISPHSSLRNYILTLPQRTLGKLRSILRVFFQEKNAADLFQAMVTTIQEPKETVQQFLLRLLDARNRVFFASKEERAESEYSSQLVENSFLKAFESGLRDENLVTNLRPFLRASPITDDELMRTVNELATKNAKRKAKLGVAKARAITAEKEKGDIQTPNVAKQLENETCKLSAEIQSLKTQLAEIKHNFSSAPQGNMPPRFSSRTRGRWQGRSNGPPRYRRLTCCRKCQTNGTMAQCDHCFQCGEHGHFRSHCPHNGNQGNMPRLFQGGAE